MVFSYMDQFECIKLQTLNRDAYYLHFPKILSTFFLDRPFVHLYIANKKALLIAYLDNYKSKEVAFSSVAQLPDRIKYFATLQHKNNVLLCGGMNSGLENPEDTCSKALDCAFDDCYIFDVKKQECSVHCRMTMKRAKHCIAMVQDPKDPYNQLVLAIGGIQISTYKDLHLKKTVQRLHDTDIVEFYSWRDRRWEVYNANLGIARHSASACCFKDYVYVVGGHQVSQPQRFINTLERCHKSVPRSTFEPISVKQREVDLSIQNQLALSLAEDNGILILSCSNGNEQGNKGYFIDLEAREMKESKFDFSVGAINHWQNCHALHDRKINFITEQQQILRFETQACEWSLFDLTNVERIQEREHEGLPIEEEDFLVQADGSHHFYKDHWYQ